MAAPVIARSTKSLQVEIEAGRHRFVADEPIEMGGADEGPTPYDYIAAALAACTSMTLKIVAHREHIPLDGVQMKVTNDRMHAKDCADCMTDSGYVHRFTIEIHFEGELTEVQRARLQEIAGRCPVAKMLTSEIRIEKVFV